MPENPNNGGWNVVAHQATDASNAGEWGVVSHTPSEQPGFLARLSEQLLGTQDPIGALKDLAPKQYPDAASAFRAAVPIGPGKLIDPIGTTISNLSNPPSLTNLGPMAASVGRVTGVPQAAADVVNKNYSGLAGTL